MDTIILGKGTLMFINFQDPFTIGILAAIFSLVCLVGRVLFVHSRLIRRCTDLQEQISGLKDDVANLCVAAINVDGQRSRLNLRLNNVLERTTTLEQCQGVSKTYHTAISEVKNGVDSQYLVDACGFSMGEAEFMVRLYGNGKCVDPIVGEPQVEVDSVSH